MKNLLIKFISIFLTAFIFSSCLTVSVSAEYNYYFENSILKTNHGDIDNSVYYDFLSSKHESNFHIRFSYINSSNSYRQVVYFCNTDFDWELSENGLYYTAYVGRMYYSASSFQLSPSVVSDINNSCAYSFYGNGYLNNSNYDSSKQAYKIYIYKDFNDFSYTPYTSEPDTVFNMVIDCDYENGLNPFIGPSEIPEIYGPYPIPNLYPVISDANYQGFVNYLIDNQKYLELSKYGINCTADSISSLVNFWSFNYNDISGFFTSLKEMWTSINAISQARNLYNWLQQQYELYKQSLVTWKFSDLPDIVTDVEYDDDGNFITSDIQYLKLILSSIIALPDRIYNSFSDFLSAININVYRLSDYMTTIPDRIYNNFVDSINMILDAINNIEIDDSSSSSTITNNNIDVNIDIDNIDNTTNNFNIAFGDLQLLLENKFSFYNQLTEITNTVQNYTYTDTAPELILNLGSELGFTDTEYKIDFSFYEPYREMIRKIIITFAYISFAISLLHKLPDIIGGI